jgi:hypothetical protein
MAKQTMLSSADLRPELIHSASGLLVLLAAITLSVFKPWGMTPYGRRQASQADFAAPPERPSYAGARVSFHGRQTTWTRIIGYHAIGLFVLFVILHVAGLHHH